MNKTITYCCLLILMSGLVIASDESVICEERSGTIVTIKENQYCKINLTYVPIDELIVHKDVKLLGNNVPNFGAMIYNDNPVIGWLIIAGFLFLGFWFIKTKREVLVEQEIRNNKRREFEANLRFDEDTDTRRRRIDGGYY